MAQFYPQTEAHRLIDGEEYLTIKATPTQALRLAELGAITATQAEQAQNAGGLLVRLPARLVAEFEEKAHPTLPTNQDLIDTIGGAKIEPKITTAAELEKMAVWLDESGMNLPARLFLSTNRPLSFVGSQFLLLAQPLARFTFGKADPTGRWSSLMENRANVDWLVNRLEQLAIIRKRKNKESR